MTTKYSNRRTISKLLTAASLGSSIGHRGRSSYHCNHSSDVYSKPFLSTEGP